MAGETGTKEVEVLGELEVMVGEEVAEALAEPAEAWIAA